MVRIAIQSLARSPRRLGGNAPRPFPYYENWNTVRFSSCQKHSGSHFGGRRPSHHGARIWSRVLRPGTSVRCTEPRLDRRIHSSTSAISSSVAPTWSSILISVPGCFIDTKALSRQRSRVRAPSSPPHIPKDLRDDLAKRNQ